MFAPPSTPLNSKLASLTDDLITKFELLMSLLNCPIWVLPSLIKKSEAVIEPVVVAPRSVTCCKVPTLPPPATSPERR
jgi:hypothetical protein